MNENTRKSLTMWRFTAVAVVTGLLIATSASADPALQDGLIAYWPFDDGTGATEVTDVVNGNNATILGGTWDDLFGKFGSSLSFSGAAPDGAVMSSDPTLDPGTNALTISSWINLGTYPSAMASGFGAIFDSRTDDYVFYMDRGNKEIRFKVTASDSEGNFRGAARPGIGEAFLQTGSWHHIVGVFDRTEARVYYDGQLIDREGLTGLSGQVRDGQAPSFGQEQYDPTHSVPEARYFANVNVDDTAVWNRALSDAEIAHLYNNGTGNAVYASNPTLAPNPAPTMPAGPVLHYTFDNGDMVNTGSGGATYNGRVGGTTGTLSYVDRASGKALDLTQEVNNPADGVHMEVDYVIPDNGTIMFWAKPKDFYNYNALLSNSVNDGDWEMWVYSTGVARFRIQNYAYPSYDLDNFHGENEWYHFAITWRQETTPDGIDVVNVGTALYVNGYNVGGDGGQWVDPGSTIGIGGGFGNAAGQVIFDDFRIYEEYMTPDQMAMVLSSIITKMPGDTNYDGVVDAKDAQTLAKHWLEKDAIWDYGDFNGDGVVNDLDASILAANWTGSSEAVGVPEPTTLVLLASALLFWAVRRRK
ncbi:MAG: PEP-CTERM sorting domain-containing protein [Pirellulales bacterium]|nr:PEP-CTERM sorting domain-containing protein [Pirellulales bacterium]